MRSLIRLKNVGVWRVVVKETHFDSSMWSVKVADQARKAMGDNFWPYGIEANRRTLDAFLQYCGEQGVTQRAVQAEELFPREAGKVFKV